MQTNINTNLNYYLLTNDDPCFHDIYDENELRQLLKENIGYHDEEWECYNDSYFSVMEKNRSSEHYEPKESKKIDELIEWLNKDVEDCNWRQPSKFHIQDNCHYNHIRRISSKL